MRLDALAGLAAMFKNYVHLNTASSPCGSAHRYFSPGNQQPKHIPLLCQLSYGCLSDRHDSNLQPSDYRSSPDLHHRQTSTQRRPRLEGAAKVRPEASRWRAKMAAPAQYLKFCRCAPNRFRATLGSICLAPVASGFAALVSLETVGEQTTGACWCIETLFLLAALYIEAAPRTAIGAASAGFLARALHLRRALVGSISRLHHRLKFFCFIAGGTDDYSVGRFIKSKEL